MRRAWHLVVLAFVVSGCGYALTGKANTLPEYIRRIGVPGFVNLSTTPDLDRLVTEAVRVELQSKRRYQVVAETTGVDAVLTGTIRSVTRDAQAFTSDRQESKIGIVVLGTAEFKETKDNKVFWTGPVRAEDEFNVVGGAAGADLATMFTQDRNALTRLAQSFAKKLVTSILDSF